MSRNARLKREAKQYQDMPTKPTNIIEYEAKKNQLTPLNESQRLAISSLKHDDVVLLGGSAGTGKTYLASRVAAQIYKANKNINQIIMTRPAVEVGKGLGFLPGELDEKYAPYMEPFEKGMMDEIGAGDFKNGLNKHFIPRPLQYMRGKTFDDCIMLLDEAQNTTIEEMKMFITRIGTNARMFITGDNSDAQNDLKVPENGLQWLIRQYRIQQKPYEIIEFKWYECVRSDVCKDQLSVIENEVMR